MADEIVIENHTTVTTVESAVSPPPVLETVVGTATVVSANALTTVEITNNTTNTTELEIPAQTALALELVEGTTILVESTTGPTGHAPELHVGTAPPDEETGTVGDLYLVTSGPTIGDLYQKDKLGWGTVKGNLRGGIASVNGLSGTNITLAASDITTGVLPIAQVPTGTSGSTVAFGNHLHTGVYEPVITPGLTTQFWRGDKSWIVIDKASIGLGNVTNVDTANASNISSGTLSFARLPTGTGGSQIAIGNHNHDTAYIALTGAQTVAGTKAWTNQQDFNGGPTPIKLVGNAADYVLIPFHARAAAPGTRSAYVGFGSAATNHLSIINEISAGNLVLGVTGAGVVQLNAPTVAVQSALTTSTLKVGTSTTAGYVLTADASGNATWQQTANIITPGTTAQYYRGDLSWQTLDKTAVGLGNVTNDAQVAIAGTQTVTGQKTFSSEIIGPSFGNVLRVGDDARLADVSLTNGMAVVGITNANIGIVAFGNSAGGFRISGTSSGVGTIEAAGGLTINGTIAGNGSGLTALPATSLTGTIDIARIPTGTTGSTVALGNHAHTGVYEPLITAGTTAQYRRGDKSWQTLNATAVGLGNVANVAQVDLTSGQTITGAKVMNSASNAFTGSGAGLTSLNATQLTSGTAPQARIVPNIQRFIFTTGSEARPTGTTYVEWIGPVQPVNSSNDDTWTDTSINVIEDPLVSMPVGIIHMYAGSGAPTNWMKCDGTAVSRSTYSVLFGIIGTAYGTGDGTSTFNLPNFSGRMPIGNDGTYARGATGGSATTTLTTPNLPSHAHAFLGASHTFTWGGQPGVTVYLQNANAVAGTPPANEASTIQSTWTTTDNTGSGTPFSTISPYLGVNFIIKVL